jgi:hypothetical protein
MLRALFPKPGHLQFLCVDLGDSQAVSIFILLHFLRNHPQRCMRERIGSKGIVACMSENVQTVFALFLLTTVVGRERERERESHGGNVCFRFLAHGRVLDLRRAGTRSVCQKCNRCSDAFCSCGICGREHGRAPSVSNFTIYANHMLLVECNFTFAFMATICWALL